MPDQVMGTKGHSSAMGMVSSAGRSRSRSRSSVPVLLSGAAAVAVAAATVHAVDCVEGGNAVGRRGSSCSRAGCRGGGEGP